MNTPDHWVIVKIVAANSSAPVFKVFATWSGGYLWGSSWKLNSGITKIEETDEHYAVHGYSGSVYKLRKGREGMSGYGMQVLDALRAQIEASGGIMELTEIPKVQEFLKKQHSGEISEQQRRENTTAKDEEKA